MLLKVGRFLTERSMVEPGDRVLVGVSGGMDSVALLHVLTRLAPTLGIAVRAAHFHHGIRDEADGDEAFVRALCAEHDVPLTVGRADVPKLAAERRLEAVRRSRAAAGAAPSPTLFLGATGKGDPTGGSEDLALVVPLDVFGRTSAARATGDAAVQAAEAELRRAQSEVQADVLARFADAAAAARK